jgi:hypothetical protein
MNHADTTTVSPGRAALEAAAPEILELEQLRARAVELAAEHHRESQFPPGVDGYEAQLATARQAIAIIAAGGDPDSEILGLATSLAAVHGIANNLWQLVAKVIDDDIHTLEHDTTDAQIEHLHELLVDVIDEARAADAAGQDLGELAGRYSSIRSAHFAALRRNLNDSNADRSPMAAKRLGWLRNIDAWEGQHRAEVSGTWVGVPKEDPWRDDHRSQFRFIVATPDAVPWAPTVEQIAAKSAELRTEVSQAFAERTGRPIVDNRVQATVRTEQVEPEPVLPAAMAKRLGVENESRPVQRARQIR